MLKNPELDLAWEFVEKTDRTIFLTGKAGTGKTTFLRSLKSNSLKRVIVVAPTGVAAINAKGVTIHSFFQMPFGPILPNDSKFNNRGSSFQHKFSKIKINIIRSLDLLVIDEISMVRSDLLDGIDQVLRRYRDKRKVFGGVQVLMIGDLQQLAPVVNTNEWNLLKNHYETPYFFSSKVFINSHTVNIELKHIYRQENQEFIRILNEIRTGEISEDSIKKLNERFLPNFIPKEDEGFITLTTHNKKTHVLNDKNLNKLKGKSQTYKAIIQGKFSETSYPTHKDLLLKKGAQVMFIKNDSNPEKRYYNGKIGKIIAIHKKEVKVQCEGELETITVSPETWENVSYEIDSKTNEISENCIGSFSQIPLRLAWAITIHKSQGLTFDKAIIDANAAFAHGQTYVALSRCRTLNGVVLKSEINEESIITDLRVATFTNHITEFPPKESDLLVSKKIFQLNLIGELLNYYDFLPPITRLLNLYYSNISSLKGAIETPLTVIKEQGIQPILKIATNFNSQLFKLSNEELDIENDEIILERIHRAITYFINHTKEKIKSPFDEFSFSTEDKGLQKEFEKNKNKIEELLKSKLYCLLGLNGNYKFRKYLKLRAESVLIKPEKPKKNKTYSVETKHPILFDNLSNLRSVIAQAESIPHFQVFTQHTLYELSELLPLNNRQLKTIHGMGKIRVQKYGDEILACINEYADENNVIIDEIVVTEKIKKVNTKLISLKLFKEGLSIPDIAKKRGLVRGTIEFHLSSFVAQGEIDIYDLISEKRFLELKNKMEQLTYENLTDLKSKLNNEYSYFELKLVLNE